MQSNVRVHVDTTALFSTCSVVLSSGNKYNQNLHSAGVGLHVDTTAYFSSFTSHSVLFCYSNKRSFSLA